MKIRYDKRYSNGNYSYQTIWARPETPWEKRFFNAIHNAMNLRTMFSDGFVWSGFTGNIKKEGVCKGCMYSSTPKDSYYCRDCSRKERSDNYRLPKRGPSNTSLLLKGLSKASSDDKGRSPPSESECDIEETKRENK